MSESTSLEESSRNSMIAVLRVSGISVSEISAQLKITKYQVAKILKSEEYQLVLKEMSDKLVTEAANTFKAAMQDRVIEALRVIDFNLKNNNLEAVKLIVKAIGVEKQEPVQQSSNLTIVMPDLSQPKQVEAIDV